MSIKAIARLEEGAALQEWEYEPHELRPQDVEISITHCGVCGTDVHFLQNEFGNVFFPLVAGHEIVGTVLKAGSEAQERGFQAGMRVGVGPQCECCHSCESCTQGDETQCEAAVDTYNDFDSSGSQTFGGFAERLVVDCHKVVPIPAGLSSEHAAPLLCAGVTVFSALKRYVKPSDKHLAVLGCGGLGHMAVKLAVSWGLEVTVLSHSESKKEDALSWGAKEVLDSSSPGAAAGRFDVILNTCSSNAGSLDPVLNMLRTDGRLVLLGMAPSVEFSGFTLFPRRLQICSSYIGSVKETQEALEYCAERNIVPTIEELPLTAEGCNQALAKQMEGKVRYRVVLVAPAAKE